MGGGGVGKGWGVGGVKWVNEPHVLLAHYVFTRTTRPNRIDKT